MQRLGDMELSQASCHGSHPVAHVETGGTPLHTLPITTQPSIPSFLFPSFIPFAFFWPQPAPPCPLASVKVKSLFSRGFLESSACCGCLAGGRTFSRSLVGLKVPISIQDNIYLLVGLGSAWQTAMLSMRARFQGQLSMGNLTLLRCFQSSTPSGLSTDAQR